MDYGGAPNKAVGAQPNRKKWGQAPQQQRQNIEVTDENVRKEQTPDDEDEDYSDDDFEQQDYT